MEKLTNSAEQRRRLLERLRQGPVTTIQARQELDVMHPAARIQELRGEHNIITEWAVVHNGVAEHTIAQYVLLPTV